MAVSVRLFLLGDTCVGKTTLVHQLIDNEFLDEYKPTVGMGEFKFRMRVGGKTVVLTLMDVAGLEPPDEKKLCRGDGALLICDLGMPESLENIRKVWLPAFRGASGSEDKRPALLIGNKVDASQNRKISLDQLTEAAAQMDLPEPEMTSARSGVNVEKEVRRFVRLVLEARGIECGSSVTDTFQIDETTALLGPETEEDKKRWGCLTCCCK